MMEGKSFSEATLKEAILAKFGPQARFHTCSTDGLNADELIKFLTAKGKFKPLNEGFTVDLKSVCEDY